MTKKIVLDVDTGVDDTMAILYAALHPAVDLVAAGSVWGNVDVDTATRNTLHTLAMAGLPDVPVAEGAAGPMDGSPAHYAYHVHGEDGQGNRGTGRIIGTPSGESAGQQLVRLTKKYPGEVEIVTVGPLTNLALGLELEPDLPLLVRGVTIMGGAALGPGNVTEVAEANIYSDPEAAAAVFAAEWPLTMVGLDVTMRVLLLEEHRAQLAAAGTIAQYVSRILDFYFDFYVESFGRRLSCMHDVLAVAIAAGTLIPTLAPVVGAKVDATNGPGRGQTLCDLRGMYMGFPEQEGARCRVVLECDSDFASEYVSFLVAAGDSAIDVSEPA